MSNRTSVIHDLFINSLSNSSIVQMGDSYKLLPVSRVLAIQREKQLFYSNELNFYDYEIFQQQLPITPFIKKIKQKPMNKHPYIKVNKMKVLAISTASIIHIGNCEQIQLDVRVKNIRHLNQDK